MGLLSQARPKVSKISDKKKIERNRMKKNILTKLLAITVSLVAGSLSAYPCQPKDFIGACGIFDEKDFQIALEQAEVAKPNKSEVAQKFLQISMKPWERVFRCYVLNFWGFWTPAQQQKVIDRMYEQGLISKEQFENWQNSPYPPCLDKK